MTSSASATSELASALHGPVLTPTTDGFADAVRGHNHAMQHDPAVVVRATDAADVATTVGVARRHGLQVQVQSSGHGPSQLTEGGVLLLTGALDGIEVDPQRRTATVGAGVLWGDLLAACAEHGLIPLGFASVASVGVAGYLLGGGMGPLGRRDGFGADHVVGMQIVDAEGRARTVDAEHDPDLFWALRGGRLVPAVVTAFTLRLGRAPTLFTATLTYSRPDVPAALAGYASWQSGLPDETTTVAGLFRFPDVPALPVHLRGRRFLQVDLVHAGDEEAGRAALDRLVQDHPPATLDSGGTEPATWLTAQPGVPPGPSWQRGMLLGRLDPQAATEVVAAAGPEADAPWQVVEVRPFGGALARPPEAANAVGGRTDGVLLSVVASGEHDREVLSTAYARLTERLASWRVPGLNVNFHGPGSADHPLREAWSPETWERLAALRAEHDPAGVFPAPEAG